MTGTHGFEGLPADAARRPKVSEVRGYPLRGFLWDLRGGQDGGERRSGVVAEPWPHARHDVLPFETLERQTSLWRWVHSPQTAVVI
jgi:hypothetical protein